MNGWKHTVQIDRSTVRAGGCLYVGMIGLFVAGVLFGIGILIGHLLAGGEGNIP